MLMAIQDAEQDILYVISLQTHGVNLQKNNVGVSLMMKVTFWHKDPINVSFNLV